jgi:hypothetical protein
MFLNIAIRTEGGDLKMVQRKSRSRLQTNLCRRSTNTPLSRISVSIGAVYTR